MRGLGRVPILAWFGAALAVCLWSLTFFVGHGNFWLKIALSTLVLGGIALKGGVLRKNVVRFDGVSIVWGVAAAASLYAVFWAGREVSSFLFRFAPGQIGKIYGLGGETPRALVFFLLLFVTGPCEELFWRGFLQRELMDAIGAWKGFALTTALYTIIHIWSFNFMLVGASCVAGAFWGFMYMRLGRLDSVIVSHALWSACIFALAPLG